jgi:hypothetical protein
MLGQGRFVSAGVMRGSESSVKSGFDEFTLAGRVKINVSEIDILIFERGYASDWLGHIAGRTQP